MSNAANALLVTSDTRSRTDQALEGLETEAYPDPGNPVTGEPWTIGYGHIRGVRRGDTCTEEQAAAWLREDLHEAEEAVRHLVDVPVTQGQFDSLTSFVFNIGATAFGNSTLLPSAERGRRCGRRRTIQALDQRRVRTAAWPGDAAGPRAGPVSLSGGRVMPFLPLLLGLAPTRGLLDHGRQDRGRRLPGHGHCPRNPGYRRRCRH